MTTSDKNKSFTLWPYAIIGAMVLFMGYIAFFVYKAMNQDVDLVSKNYYEQEIKYQDHINTLDRTKAAGDVAINYNPEKQSILIQLPESFAGQSVNGTVDLFRPSDDKLDQNIPLQLGRDQSQLIETDKLEKGLWKVRINFSAGNETYYSEKTIQIK
ncbi:FixH family protein [Pontibacter vulgaris]|uniref:FixH family protein n=1 Tax=Pontibacter vulgaris TaxID=2905679 RepID=UPI001FA745D4|nr:FixH family protein [Pontibacter vulgaris]